MLTLSALIPLSEHCSGLEILSLELSPRMHPDRPYHEDNEGDELYNLDKFTLHIDGPIPSPAEAVIAAKFLTSVIREGVLTISSTEYKRRVPQVVRRWDHNHPHSIAIRARAQTQEDVEAFRMQFLRLIQASWQDRLDSLYE